MGRYSVSQDTGWVTVVNVEGDNGGFVFEYRQAGRLVFVHAKSTGYWTVNANVKVYTSETLPASVRPDMSVPLTVNSLGGDTSLSSCYVETYGRLSLYFKNSTSYFDLYTVYAL